MFQLDMKSTKSVYEQVMDNIKELIMSGALPEDSKIPSVRELSKQLTINPNTVQKAFKELERGGYIYTVSGKGSFVSPKSEIKTDDAKIHAILSDVSDKFRQLTYLGLSPEDAKSLISNELDSLTASDKQIDDNQNIGNSNEGGHK